MFKNTHCSSCSRTLTAPLASMIAWTSKPSSTASNEGNCKHVESLIPAIMSYRRPIPSTVFLNASQHQALITPGRRMTSTSGNRVFNSGRIVPFGPQSTLVVRITGRAKIFAVLVRPTTLFLNSYGVISRTNCMRPTWCDLSAIALHFPA